MLDQRLQIGGLQVGGPRTSQNIARFRVANNVYQTRGNYLVPRYHSQNLLGPISEPGFSVDTIFSAPYRGGIFSVVKLYAEGYTSLAYHFRDRSNLAFAAPVPSPTLGQIPNDEEAPGQSKPYGIQSVEKQDCLFIFFPYYGLFKFDGVQFYRAGMPLPWIGSAQYAAAGAAYLRVIQHYIDGQGNVVNSAYVQFRATPSANIVNIRHDVAATDLVGSSEVSPVSRPNRLDFSFNSFFFTNSGSVNNSGDRTIVVTTGGDHYVEENCYVQVAASTVTTAVTGLPIDTRGIMLKVVASDATTVTLSMDEVRYLDVNGSWIDDGQLSGTTTLMGGGRVGTNVWMSVWSSNSATAAYVYKDLFPSLPFSTSPQTRAVNVASLTTATTGSLDTCFYLAPNLGDIYDVISVKDIFPGYNYLSTPTYPYVDSPFSSSTYGDLLLIATNNEVYFSDTTLGGSFEMINGLSFIVVGEGDDGIIQSVCGNSSFFVVSRQFNNYYVSGNLPTANYRVQNIQETKLGSYSNESCCNYGEDVILVNKQGVWRVLAGGRCEEVSIFVQGLFDDWSNSVRFAEQDYWDISSYPNYVNFLNNPPLVAGNNGNQWIKVRIDVSRGMIFFLIPGEDLGMKALVLNMNNGEFYTWSDFASGLGLTSPKVMDLIFIQGTYYALINSSNAARTYEEMKEGDSRYAYGSCLLETTWFTAGQPSLEKKLLQLKWFGICTAMVELYHYLDWKTDSSVENETYTNSDESLFSHKKRLDPSNFLSASVGMEITPGDGYFQVESFELEWQPFQTGMKR
jgi:hypothetical protein